jgi:hypothetical protein
MSKLDDAVQMLRLLSACHPEENQLRVNLMQQAVEFLLEDYIELNTKTRDFMSGKVDASLG